MSEETAHEIVERGYDQVTRAYAGWNWRDGRVLGLQAGRHSLTSDCP